MRWIRRRAATDDQQWDYLLLRLLSEIEHDAVRDSGVESGWIEPKDLWAAIDHAHTSAQELLDAGWAARAAELGLLERENSTSARYRVARRRWSALERTRRTHPAPELLLLMAFRSAAAAADQEPRWTWVTSDELHVPLQTVVRRALSVAVEGWEHEAEHRGLIEFADRSPLFRLTDHGRWIVR